MPNSCSVIPSGAQRSRGTPVHGPSNFLGMPRLRSTCQLVGQLVQNLCNGFPRVSMAGDGSADPDVVCPRFNCFPWSHEPFLIARFCPIWPNSLDRDFDSVVKLSSQGFDFTRTGHDSIDSCSYT